MNIQQFGEYLISTISDKMGDGYEIRYSEVIKNNGIVYHAVTIRRGDANIAPTIYFDTLYELYENGRSIETLADMAIDVYKEKMPPRDIDMSFFMDFSSVSEKLGFRVVNFEKNKNKLANVPYRTEQDLALVPTCYVSDSTFGEGTVTIERKHLNYWEVSEDELWENIFENAEKLCPVEIKSMFETLLGMKGMGFDECFEYGGMEKIFVVSNAQSLYGASVIFYHGVLDRIAEIVGTDFEILPSSVHEVIIMPSIQQMPSNMKLGDIVSDVNEHVLDREDFLSDNIYHYDITSRKLSILEA